MIDGGVVRQSSEQDDRGPGAAAADGRRPHRRRGRRQHRLGATPAARCASARVRRARCRARPATGAAAQEPTVTDANLLLGYLERRRAARRRTCGSTCEAAARAVGGLARTARPRRRRRPRAGSCASPTRRCCARCASRRSSAASTRAATRSSRSVAPVRCTPPGWPSSSGVERVLCPRAAGVLSALGLATADRRRDAGAQRAAGRGGGRGGPRRRGGRASSPPRRRAEHAGRARRGPLRPALPRARPSSWRWRRPADAGAAELRELFERAHERALRLRATPRARSSS